MNLISHRGNIDGPQLDKENSPNYINEAIEAGYNVEIDIWFVNNKWYLGHDNPTYEIKYNTCSELFWLYYTSVNIYSKPLMKK